MKTIRVHFTDMWKDFDPEKNFLLTILRKRYQVIADPLHPDYVFFSCFGMNHWHYQNAVLIEYLGEVIVPDFNACDYAIGFHFMDFGDRYLRFPLYNLYAAGKDLPFNGCSHEAAEESFQRKKFCSFLYSNMHCCEDMRKQLFHAISRVGKVDSGGRLYNNIGFRVPDKLKWLKQYQFNIACENTASPGYTTEKLIEPLIAGMIPVYWGDPEIFRIFNPDRILSVRNYSSLDALASDMRQIAADRDRFCSIVEAPWFRSEEFSPDAMMQKLEQFLFSICDRESAQAKRRPAAGFLIPYSGIIKQMVPFWKTADFFAKVHRKLARTFRKNRGPAA